MFSILFCRICNQPALSTVCAFITRLICEEQALHSRYWSETGWRSRLIGICKSTMGLRKTRLKLLTLTFHSSKSQSWETWAKAALKYLVNEANWKSDGSMKQTESQMVVRNVGASVKTTTVDHKYRPSDQESSSWLSVKNSISPFVALSIHWSGEPFGQQRNYIVWFFIQLGG